MGRSFLPRWKFTDSCGRPQTTGAMHVGCSHCDQTPCAPTNRRAFLKTGIAIVGAAGLAAVVDPRELFAQGRVFPPPPPAVSPIAGLMDTPFRIWFADLRGAAALQGLALQAGWTLALVALGRLAMDRVMRRLEMQGG